MSKLIFNVWVTGIVGLRNGKLVKDSFGHSKMSKESLLSLFKDLGINLNDKKPYTFRKPTAYAINNESHPLHLESDKRNLYEPLIFVEKKKAHVVYLDWLPSNGEAKKIKEEALYAGSIDNVPSNYKYLVNFSKTSKYIIINEVD